MLYQLVQHDISRKTTGREVDIAAHYLTKTMEILEKQKNDFWTSQHWNRPYLNPGVWSTVRREQNHHLAILPILHSFF